MDKTQKELIEYYNEFWDKMINLLEQGRSTEFLIRIASEIKSQQGFIKARTLDEFKSTDIQVKRKKLDKHIDDLLGKNSDKMKIAKQLADKLAHADYLGARNRIELYKNKFGLSAVLNSEPIKVFKANNIKHEDGSIGSIKYLLTSSAQNMTLEEFIVFDGQGYVEAAKEILEIAEKEINALIPNIKLRCSTLVLSRGLRLGEKY